MIRKLYSYPSIFRTLTLSTVNPIFISWLEQHEIVTQHISFIAYLTSAKYLNERRKEGNSHLGRTKLVYSR